jgi:hypothetical protein
MAEMAAADDRNIQTAFDGNFVGRQLAGWHDAQSDGRTKIDCSHIRCLP